MSKEIKFRAWNAEAKRYANSPFKLESLFGSLSFVLNYTDDDGKGVIKSITNEVIERFTGKQDSMLIDLYEGDIVAFTDYSPHSEDEYSNIGVVEYDEDEMCFIFTNRETVDMCDIDWDSVEKIGNIHEDQNLL